MKNKLNARIIILAVAMAISPLAVSASVWSTTAQYGQYNFSTGYAVNNDVWGGGAGPQTLYVDDTSGNAPHWWVDTQQPHGGGNIKAYPDARLNINKSINSIGRLIGNFSTQSPANGTSVHDWAFDCWVPSEVMVWTYWDRQGINGSLYQSNVNISGVTYNVYHGSYWTFARTSQTSGGSADLGAIFKWLVSHGKLGNGTVGSCQFGVEIVDGNNAWLVCNSMSFSQ